MIVFGDVLLERLKTVLFMPALGIWCAILFPASSHGQQKVLFPADDGVVVYADYYASQTENPRAVIVLFHQAGSNGAEYRAIAPRLVDEGFEAMAVDLRLGGSKFGGTNRTVAGLTGPVMSFDALLPDMRAALAYAHQKRPDVPTITWGSSYSAALVIALAAERSPKLSAVLAFSPVDLLGDGEIIDQAKLVNVPVFITYATTDGERTMAASIADAISPDLVALDEPVIAIHGSTTLDPQLNPAGYEDQWESVSRFLTMSAR